MRRRWGLAAFSCALIAAPAVASAQADVDVTATADTGGATAAPQPIAYGAMPGGMHVASAQTLPPGVASVELLSGLGRRGGLLAADHRFNRATGDVAAAFGVIDMLTVDLSLDGYYDKHWGFPSGGASGCGATC